MLHCVVFDVMIVGIVTCRSPQPTPQASDIHVLDSRVTWYGASELVATGRPRV